MSAATIHVPTAPMAESTDEELSTPRESTSQRNGYLRALAPLTVALVVLTLSTLSWQRPEQVGDWAADTFYYKAWIMHGRRLYHPHNAAAYFLCTRMLSNSDRNYDNSLTMDEYKEFTNTLADHKYSATVGQNLPKELREIFNKYAQETEGKSNQIIDIYGSRNGERDGITKHQEDLLEALCNATSNTLEEMFGQEQKDLGVTDQDASTAQNVSTDVAVTQTEGDMQPPHRQKLTVNASFAMKMPPNMTIEDLKATLKTGEDPGHLKHAFSSFVSGVVQHLHDGENGTDANRGVQHPADEVVDSVGGNATRDDERLLYNHAVRRRSELIEFDADEDEMVGGHDWRRLIEMDPNSVEIYDYVESPCPGNENTTCVTALGKYKVEVDEEEEKKEGGLTSIYEHAQKATRDAIDRGDMEKELEKEPDGSMFHVEGHGTAVDVNFNPYAEVEEEKKKSMRTLDIILISVGCTLIFCLCCVLCFVELEPKTRPRPNGRLLV